MTTDQLDEIEKEARAGGPEDDGAGDIAAFLVDCRILPLVKELREAREERDEARAERDEALERVKALSEYSGERHAFYQSVDGVVSGLVPDKNGPWVRACDAHAVEAERDEARAEAKRLREALELIAAPVAIGSAFHMKAVEIARRAL